MFDLPPRAAFDGSFVPRGSYRRRACVDNVAIRKQLRQTFQVGYFSLGIEIAKVKPKQAISDNF